MARALGLGPRGRGFKSLQLDQSMYFVYFLKSLKNEKVYVGFTSKDPGERLAEHNVGTNVWTKNNGPFVLRYFEEYSCKIDAQKRERFYKTGFGRKVRNAILAVV